MACPPSAGSEQRPRGGSDRPPPPGGSPAAPDDCQLRVLPLVGLGVPTTTPWRGLAGAGRPPPQPAERRLQQPEPAGPAARPGGRPAPADLQQWRWVRRWGRSGSAAGGGRPAAPADAWAAGGPYGFLGTPKSGRTWATPPPPGWGSWAAADLYHRTKGSEWDPWEWRLMGSRTLPPGGRAGSPHRPGAAPPRRPGTGPRQPDDGWLTAEPPPAGLLRSRRLLAVAGQPHGRGPHQPGATPPGSPGAAGGPGRRRCRPVRAAPPGAAGLRRRPSGEELHPLLERLGFRRQRLEPQQAGIGAVEHWQAGLWCFCQAPAAFPLGPLGGAGPGHRRHRHRAAGGAGGSGPVAAGARPPVQGRLRTRQSRLLGERCCPAAVRRPWRPPRPGGSPMPPCGSASGRSAGAPHGRSRRQRSTGGADRSAAAAPTGPRDGG